MPLITRPNLKDVDGVYQRLIELHAGRDDEDSLRVNTRLILTLVNHIGDEETVYQAFALAGQAPLQAEV